MTTREVVKAQPRLPWELEGSSHTMDPITLPRPQQKCHREKQLNRACDWGIPDTFHIYQDSHGTQLDCRGEGEETDPWLFGRNQINEQISKLCES